MQQTRHGAPTAGGRRRSLWPWVATAAGVVVLILVMALTLPALLNDKAEPTASPTPQPASSPAVTPTHTPTASPTSTTRRIKPTTTPKPGSSKKIAEITLPTTLKGLKRTSTETPGGPTTTRAYYGDTVSVSLLRNHSIVTDGSNLRELKDTETFRCGRQTTTAVCMSTLGDGLVVMHALDQAMTVDQLADLMVDLLAHL